MKQLGLALHGYHAAHECFPPAGIGYGWCYQGAPYGMPQYVGDKVILNACGLMMLLPYLEQMPLYEAYDQKQCACNYITSDTIGAAERRRRLQRQCASRLDAAGRVQLSVRYRRRISAGQTVAVRYRVGVSASRASRPTTISTSSAAGEMWCNVWSRLPDRIGRCSARTAIATWPRCGTAPPTLSLWPKPRTMSKWSG